MLKRENGLGPRERNGQGAGGTLREEVINQGINLSNGLWIRRASPSKKGLEWSLKVGRE